MRKNLLAIIAIGLFVACSAFTVIDYMCIHLPVQSYNYEQIMLPPDVVSNLATTDNMDSTNVITDAGATLGRVLFYDVDLSRNNTIACASCHLQEFAFSDTVAFSIGFNGGLTARNSMGLSHARFRIGKKFFWDERAATLEEQVLMPIKDGIEMGLTLDTLVVRLSAKAIYPPLFLAAFGTSTIDSARVAKALAQFIRSMNTYGSRYRLGLDSTTITSPATTPFANFTAEENEGKRLFMDATRINCQGCHIQNMFVSRGSQNTGLDSAYTDNGAGTITNDSTKNGKFRVPSLMNIALTAPYMHDGRYKTLEEVIDFYSDSIHRHANLARSLTDTITGLPKRPHYSASEKNALKAFLLTLTDTLITTDERWSNPFCVSPSTAIAEIKPMLYINLYPNPVAASENLQLDLIAGSDFLGDIRMLDRQGRLVYSKEAIFKTGSNHVDIAAMNCTPGIYILSLTRNNTQLFSKKMMIN
ncbi:MAG: cytochrome c peroxidase [Bacteroidota bacterium]